jgi:translation initiation factor IF-3
MWPIRSKDNRFNRRFFIKEHLVNEEINVPEMLVVDELGEKLGLLTRQEALAKSKERGLDLVLVAPDGKPPVCRLENYGKKRFKDKKQKQHRTKQFQMKELRLKPKIDKNDVDIKVRKAREFLEAGHKVQFNMQFKGRELAHTEFGLNVLKRIEESLEDIGKVEAAPVREGNRLIMILTKSKKKRITLEESV